MMKKIILICCLSVILINSYGQDVYDVYVKNLIPESTSSDYNWLSYVHNDVGYGGVATSRNENWFGKAGSTTYFTAGSNDMNFWTQTGNIIFFPTSGYGGSVGIGTSNPDPNFKLSVNGSIRSKEVKVEANWSDFVFYDNYELQTLEEVEQHIYEKGHLPEIPSESEVAKNGINLGEMDAKLLQKIEELTLYLIEQNKENQEQRKLIEELQKEVTALKNE